MSKRAKIWCLILVKYAETLLHLEGKFRMYVRKFLCYMMFKHTFLQAKLIMLIKRALLLHIKHIW